MNSINPCLLGEKGFAPTLVHFKRCDQKCLSLFLRRNPWKLSASNGSQKIFRFCVICGDDRFKEAWKQPLGHLWGSPPSFCQKPKCFSQIGYIPTALDPLFLYRGQDHDLVREKEQYLEVPGSVCLEDDERVYRGSIDSVPPEYKGAILKLEEFSSGMRISEIDHVYFEYEREKGISPKDVTDPYLLFLQEYREKTVQIYSALEKKGKSNQI